MAKIQDVDKHSRFWKKINTLATIAHFGKNLRFYKKFRILEKVHDFAKIQNFGQKKIKIKKTWFSSQLKCIITVFSQLNAPSVYFKLGPLVPALIESRRLIGARRLLTRCFCSAILSSSFIIAQPPKPKQSWSRWGCSSSSYSHHTVQDARYCTLQSRLYKKEDKQSMHKLLQSC